MKSTPARTFNALFSGEEVEEPQKEAPVKKAKEEKKEAKDSVHEIRVTLQMPFELHKKIKIMAHWELTSLKDIINSALEKSVFQYEKTHGELVKVPKSKNK